MSEPGGPDETEAVVCDVAICAASGTVRPGRLPDGWLAVLVETARGEQSAVVCGSDHLDTWLAQLPPLREPIWRQRLRLRASR